MVTAWTRIMRLRLKSMISGYGNDGYRKAEVYGGWDDDTLIECALEKSVFDVIIIPRINSPHNEGVPVWLKLGEIVDNTETDITVAFELVGFDNGTMPTKDNFDCGICILSPNEETVIREQYKMSGGEYIVGWMHHCKGYEGARLSIR